MKAKIEYASNSQYYITLVSINGTDAYIYKGSRIECIAMAQYHNFEVVYIAP